jgi:ferritin-like metal-binding protein YciE
MRVEGQQGDRGKEEHVATSAQEQLVKYLTDAHAMEEQSVQLLEKGSQIIGDEEIARIYRAHLMQSKEHVEHILKRLEAHGERPSKVKDAAMKAGALGIGGAALAAPDTPVKLSAAAFAFENLEIASYRLLRRLAERTADTDTVSVVDRILEQEEAAAELLEGTFDRALELTLGETASSPVTPVTPIGKPSDRAPEAR